MNAWERIVLLPSEKDNRLCGLEATGFGVVSPSGMK